MINCFIIEDEEPAVELLVFLIKQRPDLNLLGFAHHTQNLPPEISQGQTLLFLDIEMPFKSGLHFLREHKGSLPVILTTSYTQHALEAYNLHVIDYLVKPFSQTRFNEAVEKSKAFFVAKDVIKPKEEPFLLVKHDYQMVKIAQRDILYVEGYKQYLKVITAQKKYLVLYSFKQLMESLEPDCFIRIHKSFLINKQHIQEFSKTHVKVSNVILPISRTFNEYDRLKG